jgi:molybdenum cofactor cytidylyltransferase
MQSQMNLVAVLLAAGPSSRLGRPKQLMRIDDESLVCRVARLLLSLNLAKVTVVSGCEAQQVEAELAGLNVDISRNNSWADGMGGSITCGVRSLPRNADGVLLMVCDQWCVDEADLTALISTWFTDISHICVASWKEGKAFVSGPPVIFPGKYIPELKCLIKDRGARQVIDRHMEIVEFVKMENAAFDLDRPEDLELMAGRGQPSPSN